MAITTEQIHATADTLAKQGIKPTQTNVREALGGGSFSTIATALKSWRDSSTPTPKGELVIPKAVTDKTNGLIASIWQIAQQEANRQSMIERDIYIAKENSYIEQIEELQSVIATLEYENEQLQKTSHNATSKPVMTADSSQATLVLPDPVIEPQDTTKPKGKVKTPPKAKTPSQDTAEAKQTPIALPDTNTEQEKPKTYHEKKREEALQFAREIAPILKPLIGTMNQAEFVRYLNNSGIKSQAGRMQTFLCKPMRLEIA